MKKRSIFLLVFTIFATRAYAVTQRILPAPLINALQYLLIDLPKNYNVPPFILFAKLLMWMLVFALLNMGIKKVEAIPKKSGNIISLIISLMSVLLMPTSIIAYVFKTYSLVISVIAVVFPAGLGIWLNLGPLGKMEGKGGAIIRAFLWILIGLLAVAGADVIHSYPI